MILSVDFDGTCVTHDFPKTGKNIGAEIVLKEISSYCDIICVSMRSEEQANSMGVDTIQAIKDWFNNEDIKLTAINNSPGQEEWSKSRKIYANLYIDDQFVGCPLQLNEEYSNRPFVDWFKIAVIFANIGLISKKRIVGLLDDLKAKYPKLYAKYEYNELKM